MDNRRVCYLWGGVMCGVADFGTNPAFPMHFFNDGFGRKQAFQTCTVAIVD
jgi:hypothetical protein